MDKPWSEDRTGEVVSAKDGLNQISELPEEYERLGDHSKTPDAPGDKKP